MRAIPKGWAFRLVIVHMWIFILLVNCFSLAVHQKAERLLDALLAEQATRARSMPTVPCKQGMTLLPGTSCYLDVPLPLPLPAVRRSGSL